MAFIEKENKDLRSYRSGRIFTASARAAMTFILQAHKRMDPRGILLPAYIGLSKIEGSGVFDPIRTSAIDYAFYPVDERLRPDLDALESQLRSDAFQLVFLIHYFGVPQVDVEQFVALCHRYRVKVIEDCAHTLLGGLEGRRLGSYGDYAIFSIHKSTATPDGGFFLDHGGVLDVTSLPPAMRIAPATLAEFSDTDLEASARRRLSNYEAVQQWVASLPQLTPMFDRIPAGAVPLNFPVIVSQGKREQLYFNLIGREILPTALYHTLIPEISAQQFPHSHFVCTNILNLPTHADINQTRLAAYEETLRGAIHEVFST
jgi:dTDP-4-amino-4,6-dideoxygalactose transaminase